MCTAGEGSAGPERWLAAGLSSPEWQESTHSPGLRRSARTPPTSSLGRLRQTNSATTSATGRAEESNVPDPSASQPDLTDRYLGAMLGLAAGDALGTTL